MLQMKINISICMLSIMITNQCHAGSEKIICSTAGCHFEECFMQCDNANYFGHITRQSPISVGDFSNPSFRGYVYNVSRKTKLNISFMSVVISGKSYPENGLPDGKYLCRLSDERYLTCE